MRRLGFVMLLCCAPVAAQAVFSGDTSPRARSGDAIGYLNKVVARRPHHDNAHNLLGYSYRKVGEYELALAHDHRALELNPRHRQALEYLGRAYLEMHWPDKAAETLQRLGEVCRFVALIVSDGNFSDGCTEYRSLAEAVVIYERTGEPPAEE